MDEETGVSFSKELDCSLTDEEWRERSTMLGGAIEELEKAKVKAKEIASAQGAIVKKCDSRVHDLGRAVRDRREARAVLCQERREPRLFRVETVRLDTMEIIDARPMTDEELADAQQGRLFVEQGRASQEAAAKAGNEPADSHTLPDHPVLETVRGPDEKIPCPGPTPEDPGYAGGPIGCQGEECTRCAGLLFIPPPVAASEPDAEGTAIETPDALLAGAAAVPEAAPAKGGKGAKGGRGLNLGAH
jgi:hypothetical protein